MACDLLTNRMGVFAELASKSGRRFGRTALMKLCYFLQEVKEVPLNYDFSLYTYGPFDSEVLADLQTAEELNILATEFEQYPGGYGYSIGVGQLADKVRRQAREFLLEHLEEIDWAAETLASKKPADLELASTIVFVFKEKPSSSDDTLVKLVRSVKPHFSDPEVRSQMQWLRDHNLLEAQTVAH